MHKAKPGATGSLGRQVDRSIGPPGKWTSQPRANVSQCNEITFAGMGGPGAQPFSFIASAPIVREYAFPLGIWVELSHCPSQEAGASNEVVAPGVPHTAVLAMSVDGSAHDPVGGWHVHTSHKGGATRSARPS
jgi:hypothetical protein